MDDDSGIIAEFLVESHENLDQLDRDLVGLEQRPGSRDRLSSIFRTIHTIKGTSGFLAFNRLEALTHVGENLLSRLRDGEMTMDGPTTEVLLRMVDTVRALLDRIESTGQDVGDEVDVGTVVAALRAVLEGPPVNGNGSAAEPAPRRLGEILVERGIVSDADIAEALAEQSAGESADPGRRTAVDSSVRVDVDLLDSLVQLAGELVLTRDRIVQRTEGTEDVELVRAVQRLDLVASELQQGIMRTRVQPIGQVWSKMPRVVRDLAVRLGRDVDLQMEGYDTEIDRSLLEALNGPLTHLVRNALDHGIESPADRTAAGKDPKGRLLLRSFHESGQVVVEVTDDGRGIDPATIARVAVERGVITRDQAARMKPREIVHLVFRPGFTTATEVTKVSGRGVGMDVVRTNIEGIGGTVDLQSDVGVGTTCRMRIPLTPATIAERSPAAAERSPAAVERSPAAAERSAGHVRTVA